MEQYLNTVKTPDKNALKEPFNIEDNAEFVHSVEQCIASSFLLGMFHAAEETSPQKINADDSEIPPVPFTEAIDFLKSKVPLTKTEWKKLEPKLRFRAFTVAKLGTAEEIEKAKKILTRAIKDGETYAATWQTVKETLNGKGTLNPNYWETVFRTNTQSAYIAGKLQKYQETNVKAFQLMVIEDSRTSPFCRSLLDKATGYGMILPVNHQFWKTYGFPPYHFNCRTSICPVYGSMIGKAGYIVEDIPMKHFSKFKPQKGFGGNPLDRGNWWDMTDNMVKRAKDFGIFEQIKEKYTNIDGEKTNNVKKGYAAKLRESFNEKTSPYLGKLVQNKATNIEAGFSTTSQRELRSQLNDSKRNGFTIGEHFEMANQIIDLFENATLENEHEDVKHGRPDLRVERFLSKEKILSTGKKAKVCITVKHSLKPEGRIIYSLEVMDTKKALEQTRAKGQRQK